MRQSRRGIVVKKPVNKFAVTLWVLAVVVLIGELGQTISLLQSMSDAGPAAQIAGNIMGRGMWFALLGSLSTPAQLAGLGVIIEILDQIRWNTDSRRP
jgi:hypothetical protein